MKRTLKLILVLTLATVLSIFFLSCGEENGTSMTISDDGYLVIDGVKSEYKVVGDSGPQGEKGEQGEQGLQGLQGEKGERGEQGAGIEKVEFDEDGKLLITLTDGTVLDSIEMPEKEEHGHTFTEWTLIDYSSLESCETGVLYSICDECDHVELRRGSYLDHRWIDGYNYDKTSHWKLCGICGSDSEKESHAYKDGSCELCLSKKPLVLSLSAPLTGPYSVYGIPVRNGALLAVEEINKIGGINGIEVLLNCYDDKADVSLINGIYREMMENGAQISLGCVTSNSCAEFAELSKDNLFYLTPSASSDDAIKYGNGYQMCYADSRRGAAIAEYFNDNYSTKKIGILYDSDDAYSVMLCESFIKALNTDLKNSLKQTSITSGATNFSEQVSILEDCDVIFMPIYYREAYYFMSQAVGHVKNSATYFGADTILGIDTDFDLSEIPQSILCTAVNSEDYGVKYFIEEYTETYGNMDSLDFAAEGFDAVLSIYFALCEALDNGLEFSADTTAKEFLEILTATFDEGFSTYDKTLTGKNVYWDENGFVHKDLDPLVIKGGGDIKIGLILLHGSSSAYDKGFIDAIREVQNQLRLKDDQIIIRTDIPESDHCLRAAEALAESGCDIIFANSPGHERYLIEAAKKFPEVEFCNAQGNRAASENLPNFHNAYASIYEGRYLSGIAAGLKLNEMISDGSITANEAKIGYVGAFPYAECISQYTAFFLGARSVCPSVTMKLKFAYSWYDSYTEKEIARYLIDNGCVILSQHSDSNGVPDECNKSGIPNFSYNSSYMNYSDSFVMSTSINWAPYFEYIYKAVLDGESIAQNKTGSLADGSVIISSINENVAAADTESILNAVKAELIAGTLDVFDTDSFTVNGERLPEDYMADLIYDEAYTPDTDVVENGVFLESYYVSAPYFDLLIDGITILD